MEIPDRISEKTEESSSSKEVELIKFDDDE